MSDRRTARSATTATPEILETPSYANLYAAHFVLERHGGVLTVRLHSENGPAIFSRSMLRAWGQLLRDIGADPGNEILIMTGTGDRWIAGVDAASFATPLKSWSADELYAQYADGVALLEAITALDIPTIGVINGPGPRLEAALLCDLTLCSDDAAIGDGNFSAGSTPGDGLLLILRETLGPKRAAHLAYTGQRLDASAALAVGLVTEVHSRTKLGPRARSLAASIMAQPRMSRRLTHALVQQDWRRLIADDLRGAYAHQLFGSLAL